MPGLPDGAFPDQWRWLWRGLVRRARPAGSVSRSAVRRGRTANLVNLAEQIKSGLFLAHLRAAYHGLVQRTNSHPFRHGCWTFQHNGEISDFDKIKRSLQMAVDPDLFIRIQGTTDSETAFYLALSLGLDDNPQKAMERMVGLVESEQRKAGNQRTVSTDLRIE